LKFAARMGWWHCQQISAWFGRKVVVNLLIVGDFSGGLSPV
jgi:hypothetical protein